MGAVGLDAMVSAAKNADAGELEEGQLPVATPGDVRGATGGASIGGEIVVVRDGPGKKRGAAGAGDTMALDETLPPERATESASNVLDDGMG
jgi:hypothetical protein